MTAADLVDRLAEHKTVGAAPRAELEWLAGRGALRRLDEGEVLSAKGQPVAGMFVVLSGHIAIFVDRGAGRKKVIEWRAGDVAGMLPYSRLVSPPGDSVAQEPSEILAIPRDELPAMIRDCHETTAILVHKMLDRSRMYTAGGLQDEKMVSLGKLSAGLAHELNNPVAAIERSAALLDDRVEDACQSARALGASGLTGAQLAAVDAVHASSLSPNTRGVPSPLEQAGREDRIADWLADHGVDAALAATLAETAVTIESLDRIAQAVSGPPLTDALRWVAAGSTIRTIASEIQESAHRIAGLVMAIKGFTHMDQATVAEPMDLGASLGNTVAVLHPKARSKSATIVVNVEPDLPRVLGFIGELNQVWANLIDNALDAIADAGRVEVTATRERHCVVVRVIDNGAGIPAGIRDRLFDPFFTTKPVGHGTGLGLDIVRRLITHNDAEIDVESVPGRTEFRVSLRVADPPAG